MNNKRTDQIGLKKNNKINKKKYDPIESNHIHFFFLTYFPFFFFFFFEGLRLNHKTTKIRSKSDQITSFFDFTLILNRYLQKKTKKKEEEENQATSTCRFALVAVVVVDVVAVVVVVVVVVFLALSSVAHQPIGSQPTNERPDIGNGRQGDHPHRSPISR